MLKPALDQLYTSFDYPESALDPVQIVRRYDTVADREIVGFIAAGLAFGRVASVMASVEAVLAAGLGTVFGFVLFWLFRPLVARIPFTGHPFFTGDLSLGWMAIAGVLIGVPMVAALAAIGVMIVRRGIEMLLAGA